MQTLLWETDLEGMIAKVPGGNAIQYCLLPTAMFQALHGARNNCELRLGCNKEKLCEFWDALRAAPDGAEVSTAISF